MATARRYRPPPEAIPEGPPIGRARVASDTGPIRPEPVVVDRELVIVQRQAAVGVSFVAIAPSTLRVSTPEALTLRVEWRSTNATSYRLYIQTSALYSQNAWAGITPIDVQQAGDDISVDITALQDGTKLVGEVEYTIAVVSRLFDGTRERFSDFSPRVFGIPLFAGPAAPTVTATATALHRRIRVSWDAVPDATLYYAQQRVSGTTTWVNIGQLGGLLSPRAIADRAFTFTGRAGFSYEFRVRGDRPFAFDGAWSTEASAVAPDFEPAVPTNFAAAPSTTQDNAIVLTWTKSARATGYEIRWRVSGGSFQSVIVGNVATWTQSGLTRGTLYEYEIRATGSAALAPASDWSTTVSARAALLAPATPSAPTLARRTLVSGGLRITWTSAARATGYDVRYRVQGGNWTTLTDQTSPVDFVGALGSTYEAQVRATRTNAEDSPWSTSSSAVIAIPLPPDVPTISVSATDLTVSVSTDLAARATEYRMNYRTGSDAYTSTAWGTARSWTFTGRQGSTYDVFVQARNAGGTSMSATQRIRTIIYDALYAIASNNNNLYRISTRDASETLIGSVGSGDWESLAWDGTNLYAIDNASNNLYRISKIDASKTLVGNVGSGVWEALAWDGTNLYAMDNSAGAPRLYNISRTDASKTLHATQFSSAQQGIAIVGTDFYGVNDHREDIERPPNVRIVHLTLGTWQSLAWDGINLYTIDNRLSRLHRIDIQQRHVAIVGSVSRDYACLTWAP